MNTLQSGKPISKNFKLLKKIESLDKFWEVINKEKSIFALHRMFPTAFFHSWCIKGIKTWLNCGWFWTAERIERPKIYLGTCKRSAQGYTNINSYWIQCEDGLYRSKSSTVELTQEQIESDVKQGYLKRIRNESFEVNFIKMFNNE